ncbi:hypothetical protein LQ419_19510 [Gordonia paraffinivorans]|nr:hypothetical protein [Gordonia paraffinivorans]
MTVMMDTPDVERPVDSRPRAVEPLPELETVAHGQDLTLAGAIADPDTLDDAMRLEVDMLTALVWAPPQLARSVVEAIIGTHTDRQAGTTTTVLPAGSVLFWRDAHQDVWDTVVTLLDEASPATPVLVNARLADRGLTTRTRGIMLEIASPPTRPPRRRQRRPALPRRRPHRRLVPPRLHRTPGPHAASHPRTPHRRTRRPLDRPHRTPTDRRNPLAGHPRHPRPHLNTKSSQDMR